MTLKKKILWLREKVLLRDIQVQQLEMRGKNWDYTSLIDFVIEQN